MTTVGMNDADGYVICVILVELSLLPHLGILILFPARAGQAPPQPAEAVTVAVAPEDVIVLREC